MTDERAEFFGVLGEVLGVETWFDLWHTHVDWKGRGDEDVEVRRASVVTLLEGLEVVHERMAGRAFEAWVSLVDGDAGSDALYVHTPNPQSGFPADHGHVTWGVGGHPEWGDLVPREVEVGRGEFVDDEGTTWGLWFLRRRSSL